MDLPAILIKITGFILLAWTLFSIYKHVQDKKRIAKETRKEQHQSVSEQILNNILLYLWLAFCLVFSVGMMVNN